MPFDYKSIEPVELGDGSWGCNQHQLKICPFCTVDYSFMDELSDDTDENVEENLEEDIEMGENASGLGDDELFPPDVGRRAIPNVCRFIRRDDATQFLIYVDGACLNNGQVNPKAGWAFVFRPSTAQQHSGTVSGRLENKGPLGDDFAQTSNRAELRAVIGALRFRHWEGEGFSTLVIATDSEYVTQGATAWARGWVRNGWKTSSGADVKNKDLWKLLLGLVEMTSRHGLEIQFWRIPRTLNETADHAAKQAAEGQDEDTHRDIFGVLV